MFPKYCPGFCNFSLLLHSACGPDIYIHTYTLCLCVCVHMYIRHTYTHRHTHTHTHTCSHTHTEDTDIIQRYIDVYMNVFRNRVRVCVGVHSPGQSGTSLMTWLAAGDTSLTWSSGNRGLVVSRRGTRPTRAHPLTCIACTYMYMYRRVSIRLESVCVFSPSGWGGEGGGFAGRGNLLSSHTRNSRADNSSLMMSLGKQPPQK